MWLLVPAWRLYELTMDSLLLPVVVPYMAYIPTSLYQLQSADFPR